MVTAANKAVLALVAASFLGCGADASQQDAGADELMRDAGAGMTPMVPPVSVGPLTPRDADEDGLCDRTERQLASNPNSADSDADGLPDLIEVGNGFDATNPGVPAEDQVARLIGEPGATLDFPVHLTVTGTGATLTGYFEVIGSIYNDGKNAGDFVQGTTATEANPTDGARRVEPGSARFAGVLGRTRLSFSVRFEYPSAADPVRCARAYPLRYSLKSEDGTTAAERLFLLVVAPEPEAGEAPPFCKTVSCQ